MMGSKWIMTHLDAPASIGCEFTQIAINIKTSLEMRNLGTSSPDKLWFESLSNNLSVTGSQKVF